MAKCWQGKILVIFPAVCTAVYGKNACPQKEDEMAELKQRFDRTDLKRDSFSPIKTDLVERLTQEAKNLSARPVKYQMNMRHKDSAA